MRVSRTLKSRIKALALEGYATYKIAELLSVSECVVVSVLKPGL